MSNWLFLSYPLNEKDFGYGNGERFSIKIERDMCCGDSSNNTSFSMPTHYGTHIDFPFHFSVDGKKSTDYRAEDFIFNDITILEIDSQTKKDLLIRNNDFIIDKNASHKTDLLIMKTGFCYKRQSDEYWEKGLGFHEETADYLKRIFPNLRAIAFDLISLNSYQHREMGRKAHKEFLIKNDILIIEEVDLRNVSIETKFEQIIISPLLIDKCDGAPVTILAKI